MLYIGHIADFVVEFDNATSMFQTVIDGDVIKAERIRELREKIQERLEAGKKKAVPFCLISRVEGYLQGFITDVSESGRVRVRLNGESKVEEVWITAPVRDVPPPGTILRLKEKFSALGQLRRQIDSLLTEIDEIREGVKEIDPKLLQEFFRKGKP